jgi:hypothetical protein
MGDTGASQFKKIVSEYQAQPEVRDRCLDALEYQPDIRISPLSQPVDRITIEWIYSRQKIVNERKKVGVSGFEHLLAALSGCGLSQVQILSVHCATESYVIVADPHCETVLGILHIPGLIYGRRVR